MLVHGCKFLRKRFVLRPVLVVWRGSACRRRSAATHVHAATTAHAGSSVLLQTTQIPPHYLKSFTHSHIYALPTPIAPPPPPLLISLLPPQCKLGPKGAAAAVLEPAFGSLFHFQRFSKGSALKLLWSQKPKTKQELCSVSPHLPPLSSLGRFAPRGFFELVMCSCRLRCACRSIRVAVQKRIAGFKAFNCVCSNHLQTKNIR